MENVIDKAHKILWILNTEVLFIFMIPILTIFLLLTSTKVLKSTKQSKYYLYLRKSPAVVQGFRTYYSLCIQHGCLCIHICFGKTPISNPRQIITNCQFCTKRERVQLVIKSYYILAVVAVTLITMCQLR